MPVASFLHGGLDSSLITAMAASRNPSIEAYTITFRAQDQRLEAMPDDAVYARKMAAHLGIRLHEIEISPDVVDMLPRMVDVLDEPVGDPAAINTLLMCSARPGTPASRCCCPGWGRTSCSAATAGTSPACSAPGTRAWFRASSARGSIAPSVERLPVAAGGRGLRYSRWAKRFLSFAELPEEEAYRRSYTLYDPDEAGSLLGPALQADVGAVLDLHRAVYLEGDLADHVNRMCHMDARLFLPALNLAYTDRASMAASTEVRVPFVDPVVYRAAFCYPGTGRSRASRRRCPAARPHRTGCPAT